MSFDAICALFVCYGCALDCVHFKELSKTLLSSQKLDGRQTLIKINLLSTHLIRRKLWRISNELQVYKNPEPDYEY